MQGSQATTMPSTKPQSLARKTDVLRIATKPPSPKSTAKPRVVVKPPSIQHTLPAVDFSQQVGTTPKPMLSVQTSVCKTQPMITDKPIVPKGPVIIIRAFPRS